MATHYLIKQKTHSFLTQQLNMFYPLKDLRRLLFSKFPSKSLNPSKRFLKCFIIFTFYLILSYIFLFLFIPRHFKILVPGNFDFKFTVLYNDVYRKKLQ